jgi:hypothetical protein
MSAPSIRVFVPNVPEFAPLVAAAEQNAACRISAPLPHYRLIESEAPLEFRRKELGVKPAVWYGLFTGGLRGHIEIFDRDLVRIVPVA